MPSDSDQSTSTKRSEGSTCTQNTYLVLLYIHYSYEFSVELTYSHNLLLLKSYAMKSSCFWNQDTILVF